MTCLSVRVEGEKGHGTILVQTSGVWLHRTYDRQPDFNSTRIYCPPPEPVEDTAPCATTSKRCEKEETTALPVAKVIGAAFHRARTVSQRSVSLPQAIGAEQSHR